MSGSHFGLASSFWPPLKGRKGDPGWTGRLNIVDGSFQVKRSEGPGNGPVVVESAKRVVFSAVEMASGIAY